MSEHDLSHLLPAARAVALRPDGERINWIRSEHWIEHPTARNLLTELQTYVEQPARGRMRNVLLYAPSGMGKSQTLKQLELHYQARNRALGMRTPSSLYVLMPRTPKTRDFLVEINDRLGAPVSSLRRESALRDDTIRLLQECDVRALLIDEINSILAASPLQQRAFLQLLRFLSNKLGVTLICAGTPEAKHALMGDPQLRSRFTDIELERWHDGEGLRTFLALLVQSLPLRRPSPVDSPSIRKFVVERSAGLTTNICEAFERAAIAEIRSGREMLDRSSLEGGSVWHGGT